MLPSVEGAEVPAVEARVWTYGSIGDSPWDRWGPSWLDRRDSTAEAWRSLAQKSKPLSRKRKPATRPPLAWLQTAPRASLKTLARKRGRLAAQLGTLARALAEARARLAAHEAETVTEAANDAAVETD